MKSIDAFKSAIATTQGKALARYILFGLTFMWIIPVFVFLAMNEKLQQLMESGTRDGHSFPYETVVAGSARGAALWFCAAVSGWFVYGVSSLVARRKKLK